MRDIKNVQEMLYLKTDAKIIHAVNQKATLSETIIKMNEFKIGSIAIVDDENKLVGIFSERDILKRCFEDGKFLDLEDRFINDYMTYSPHTVYPTDSLASAVGSFLMAKSRHIPVVDAENHLVGMLSIRDVFENLSILLQEVLLEAQDADELPPSESE